MKTDRRTGKSFRVVTAAILAASKDPGTNHVVIVHSREMGSFLADRGTRMLRAWGMDDASCGPVRIDLPNGSSVRFVAVDGMLAGVSPESVHVDL
jgi:hypothetical protein